MMHSILEFARKAKVELAIPTGRVLEVGSMDVNGSPRSVFLDDSIVYIGVDMELGKGVDYVMDAETMLGRWCFGSHKGCYEFDTVICMECLEHTVRPWIVVENMKTKLKSGGHLWISTPTYGFPLHRYPLDCYRFGEDAYRHWLFADMELLRLEHVKDELGQPAIVAVGRKI